MKVNVEVDYEKKFLGGSHDCMSACGFYDGVRQQQ